MTKENMLSALTMRPEEFLLPSEKIEFLDGQLLPRGVCTGLFTGPGMGKTTAEITAAIASAIEGEFRMFGCAPVDRKMKSLLILGEDTKSTLRNSFANSPLSDRDVQEAVMNGVSFMPLLDAGNVVEEPEVFGEDGKLTEHGRDLFREIRQSGPWDLIVFDTLTSLSLSEYLDRRSSYATTNLLNSLANDTGACVIYNAHLTKSAGLADKKSAKDITARQVISMAAGSGGLPGAARNMIVITERPEGIFDNIEKPSAQDDVYLGACKTNVNPEWNMKLFPVIKDAVMSTLRVVDDAGVPLLESDGAAEREIQRKLRHFIVDLIAAGSALRKPFSSSDRNAFSVPKVCQGSLVDISVKATEAQYKSALSSLERMGKIVACKTSRSGGSAVWDTPDGDYANESEYEARTGGKLEFIKGAAAASEVEEAINRIREERENPKQNEAPAENEVPEKVSPGLARSTVALDETLNHSDVPF